MAFRSSDMFTGLALASALIFAAPLSATNYGSGLGPKAPCGTGGTVVEKAPRGFTTTFELFATDKNGRNIPGSRQVKTGQGNVTFTVPGTIGGVKVCDYRNRTVKNEHARRGSADPDPFPLEDEIDLGAGAMSVLHIKSLFQDPDSAEYSFEGHMALLRRGIGSGSLLVPDLYADTNGDGIIGDGDILYSWVDIRAYLEAPAIFQLGDTFQIVDGRIAGIPGMWFSATPIFLDPLLGPRPTGGAWYSSSMAGFSDSAPDAEAFSLHQLSAVPEPAVWAQMIAGLLIAGMAIRRRPSRAQVTTP